MKFSKERCSVVCVYVCMMCVCLHIPFWLIGGGRWRLTVFMETVFFSENYGIFSSFRLGTLLEAFPNSKKPCQVSHLYLACHCPSVCFITIMHSHDWALLVEGVTVQKETDI